MTLREEILKEVAEAIRERLVPDGAPLSKLDWSLIANRLSPPVPVPEPKVVLPEIDWAHVATHSVKYLMDALDPCPDISRFIQLAALIRDGKAEVKLKESA